MPPHSPNTVHIKEGRTSLTVAPVIAKTLPTLKATYPITGVPDHQPLSAETSSAAAAWRSGTSLETANTHPTF